MPRIQFTTPEGASGTLDLDAERMTLGRADDNQLIITDDSVSSHHGEIAFDGASWTLTDLGSTNGTKVGGARVESVALAPGAVFQLGNVNCVFVGDGEDEAVYSAPTMTVSTPSSGYGSHPYDRSLRRGFGPKVKEKSSGGGLLILLGVLGLAACGTAAYFAMQMGAS
ncbi:FHA domain-containing protein [Prosthecobacter sp.]|uniref:FHA domain-containing protein n=1 Tax=Prosthecobacter sp. TaxID=1965333 RepID=UPI001DECA4FB|nr:FHA domain-containing protein [Prosthecobacter sp.]MCB1277086.1 FHA domain-containing protein [Prosthecobacter sp.]